MVMPIVPQVSKTGQVISDNPICTKSRYLTAKATLCSQWHVPYCSLAALQAINHHRTWCHSSVQCCGFLKRESNTSGHQYCYRCCHMPSSPTDGNRWWDHLYELRMAVDKRCWPKENEYSLFITKVFGIGKFVWLAFIPSVLPFIKLSQAFCRWRFVSVHLPQESDGLHEGDIVFWPISVNSPLNQSVAHPKRWCMRRVA